MKAFLTKVKKKVEKREEKNERLMSFLALHMMVLCRLVLFFIWIIPRLDEIRGVCYKYIQ